MKLRIITTTAVIAIAAASAGAAHAALPGQAKGMLETAIASGNEAEIDTIAKYVSAANPQDADEVAAMVKAHRDRVAAAKQAELENASFLENWHGTGQIGGFNSSGNTDSTGLTAGVGLTKDGIRWRHNFRAITDYQRTNGVTSRNQMLIALEPNYKFNDRLFAYGLAQYEKDRFAGFDSRVTLSGGLGYRVIDAPNQTLDIKAGPAWRKTSFTAGGSDSVINGFGGLDYRLALSDTVTFTENATAFVGSGNKVFTSVTALNAKLSAALTAQVALQMRHETDPRPGFDKTDRLTRMSLIYGF